MRHEEETLLAYARDARSTPSNPQEIRACALRTATDVASGGGGMGGGSSDSSERGSPGRGWGLSSLWRGVAGGPTAREAEMLAGLEHTPLEPLLVRAASLLHAIERIKSLEAVLAPMLPASGSSTPQQPYSQHLSPACPPTSSDAVMTDASALLAPSPSPSFAGSATSGGLGLGPSLGLSINVGGAAGRARSVGASAGSGAGDFFARARGALVLGVRHVCELIGCKVILVDARIHERLYNPRLADASLRVQLQEINIALGTVVRCTPRPVQREAVVRAILREACRAFEHAVLHVSSPCRFEDVPRLREDVALLRDFFMARDSMGVPQGVPMHQVDVACRPLHGLLVLLASPSELLVRMWESAEDHADEPSRPPAPATDGGADGGGALAAGAVGPQGEAIAADGEGGLDVAAGRLSDRQRIARVLVQRTDEHARSWVAARQPHPALGRFRPPAAAPHISAAEAPESASGLRARLGAYFRSD